MNYPTYMQPGYPGNQAQPYPPRPDMQGYPPQGPQQPLQGPQTVQQAMQGISPYCQRQNFCKAVEFQHRVF